MKARSQTIVTQLAAPDFKKRTAELAFSRDANLLEADRAIFINGAKVIAPRKRKMNPAK